MSIANGLASANAQASVPVHPFMLPELLGVVTLAAGLTLTAQYRNVLKLDPGGAHRDVLLPPEQPGLWYLFVNGADAAENLVIKDDSGGTTVGTVNQNEAALVVCQGTTWYLVAVWTIALS